jgi:hypothetical protein
MLAEVVAAVAPAEPPPPKHVMPNVAPADAGRLAQRLALLTGNGTNLPPGAAAGRLAKRLASSGAARIRAD